MKPVIDWKKVDGLIPAIVQDADSGQVLMLGYMNPQALEKTRSSGHVTFFSRTRKRLWTKGETSGNRLDMLSIHADCDGDTLLVKARPSGPVCHLGTPSCFATDAAPPLAFLPRLEKIILARRNADPSSSYSARLWRDGTLRVAQKVGEEAVETALAAVASEPVALIGEAADLVYHLLVLLALRGLDLDRVCQELQQRHQAAASTCASGNMASTLRDS